MENVTFEYIITKFKIGDYVHSHGLDYNSKKLERRFFSCFLALSISKDKKS